MYRTTGLQLVEVSESTGTPTSDAIVTDSVGETRKAFRKEQTPEPNIPDRLSKRTSESDISGHPSKRTSKPDISDHPSKKPRKGSNEVVTPKLHTIIADDSVNCRHGPVKLEVNSPCIVATAASVTCENSSSNEMASSPETFIRDNTRKASTENNMMKISKFRPGKKPLGAKRTLITKSLEVKYKAILEVEKGEKTKMAVAKMFNMKNNTLSGWIKNADQIKTMFSKKQSPKAAATRSNVTVATRSLRIDGELDDMETKRPDTASPGASGESKKAPSNEKTPITKTITPDGVLKSGKGHNKTKMGDIRSAGTGKLAQKRVLSTKTLDQKYKAILEVEKGEKTKTAVAKMFNVKSSTLSGWLKKADMIKTGHSRFGPHRRVIRYGTFHEMESLLISWISSMQDRNFPVSGPIVLDVAQEFATKMGIKNFSRSTGWLDRFKERHGITFRGGCAVSKTSLSRKPRTDWEERLNDVIQSYDANDIYNADEIGILFRLVPDGTFGFKTEQGYAAERSENRLTVLACTNSTGSDKLPLFVVGKSPNSACFQNVLTLPLDYESNPNAWMTADIFSRWLTKLDKIIQDEGRRIVLIVDSCPAHPIPQRLRSVQLVYLPDTRRSQPMDEGITSSLRNNYKKVVIMKQLECLDRYSSLVITELDALYLLQLAWKRVSRTTILTAFARADCVRDAANRTDDNDVKEYLPQTTLQHFGVVDADKFFTTNLEFALPTCANTVEDDLIDTLLFARKDSVSNDDSVDDAAGLGATGANGAVENETVVAKLERKEPVNVIEALEAYNTLRSFFQSREDTDRELEMVSSLYSRLVDEDFKRRSTTYQVFQNY